MRSLVMTLGQLVTAAELMSAPADVTAEEPVALRVEGEREDLVATYRDGAGWRVRRDGTVSEEESR